MERGGITRIVNRFVESVSVQEHLCFVVTMPRTTYSNASRSSPKA